MKYFFTTLRNISLTDFNNDFIELLPALKITNRKEIKARILSPKNREIIGILETMNILNSNAFVYYEYEDNEPIWKGLKNIQILEIILNWIDSLLKNSWLHKDNCIVCDTAFLIDSSPILAGASSLRLEYIQTLATGGIDTVNYTANEITEMVSIHHKVEMYLSGRDSATIRFMLEKNFSRIGRALLFVKQGREARNLAYKLSNYCSALETLFTTDSMELSHKLAERTAFFLADRLTKSDVFSIIKKAYTVRSKLSHGASLDSKQIENLFFISKETDNILRIAFNKILNDSDLTKLFDSDNLSIDDYFLKLIMN